MSGMSKKNLRVFQCYQLICAITMKHFSINITTILIAFCQIIVRQKTLFTNAFVIREWNRVSGVSNKSMDISVRLINGDRTFFGIQRNNNRVSVKSKDLFTDTFVIRECNRVSGVSNKSTGDHFIALINRIVWSNGLFDIDDRSIAFRCGSCLLENLFRNMPVPFDWIIIREWLNGWKYRATSIIERLRKIMDYCR